MIWRWQLYGEAKTPDTRIHRSGWAWQQTVPLCRKRSNGMAADDKVPQNTFPAQRFQIPDAASPLSVTPHGGEAKSEKKKKKKQKKKQK